MIYVIAGLFIFWAGFFVGYLRWNHRRPAGMIMVGDDGGEPKLNLVIYEQYADNLDLYDYIELEVRKYDPQFIQSLK